MIPSLPSDGPKLFVLLSYQRSGSTFIVRELDDHPHIQCYGALFGREDNVWLGGRPGSKIGRLREQLGPAFDDRPYRLANWHRVLDLMCSLPAEPRKALRGLTADLAARRTLADEQTALANAARDELVRIDELIAAGNADADLQKSRVVVVRRLQEALIRARDIRVGIREIRAKETTAAPVTRWVGFKHMIKVASRREDPVMAQLIDDDRFRAMFLYRANYLASFSSELLVRVTGQAHLRAGEKAKRGTVEFDAAHFNHYWRERDRLLQHWREEFARTKAELLVVEYNEMRATGGAEPFVRFLGEEPVAKATQTLAKRNSDDILSRFDNPDDVRRYLDEIGRPEWANEQPAA
jgi:hypothetical protein